MSNKQPKFHSLSRRIMAQFCLFSLFMAVIYGLMSFTLLYTLEDRFIEREVQQEADYLRQGYLQTAQWPAPRSANMTLHFDRHSFPADMRQQSIDEPNRREFYGQQGRHYHLYRFNDYDNVYLLSEVSDSLLVRPVREGVIQFLAWGGVLLTLIACLIAWLLGRKTAKPLKQLANLVDGVAPEQLPQKFAHQYPRNEIGILARTLEQTMSQINLAMEREKCFTRDVSHELRTPVAIIKNAVELYQQSPNTDNSEAIIKRIGEAANQMEQTVTTLLVLARHEHSLAEKQAVKLLPLIEQAIIDHQYLLTDKHIEIEVDDHCDVSIISQPGMIKVLLDNLLSNAFQYTERGQVSVSFNANTLTIADTGPGIADDISAKVTEPAVKGSQSTGYGFGLSIVKRLCEHQNWLLSVQSQQGTAVSVCFLPSRN
ncbi:sensor histidine kinase [Shewanella waksmanii]|uniref:sensor histidine kinase n=1 Tax=Shewanella waksmanii TaxID=213783 RepID=UPI000490FEA9|nr:HAMP domain-containing sensor histidine kinase [Shewanella waksmanii]